MTVTSLTANIEALYDKRSACTPHTIRKVGIGMFKSFIDDGSMYGYMITVCGYAETEDRMDLIYDEVSFMVASDENEDAVEILLEKERDFLKRHFVGGVIEVKTQMVFPYVDNYIESHEVDSF